MPSIDIEDLKQCYQRHRFISGVRILNAGETATHRQAMESVESKIGSLHYKTISAYHFFVADAIGNITYSVRYCRRTHWT